jgi:hypothetical protein
MQGEPLITVGGILSWVLRIALASLLIFAGVAKLADPTAFALEIVNYRLLSSLAPILAVTLPMIEIVLGLALVASPRAWRRAAAAAVAALMVIFTVAVAQVVARGINVSCGCFGGDSGPVTAWTVIRDVVLFGAAWLAYVLS